MVSSAPWSSSFDWGFYQCVERRLARSTQARTGPICSRPLSAGGRVSGPVGGTDPSLIIEMLAEAALAAVEAGDPAAAVTLGADAGRVEELPRPRIEASW